MTRIEHRIHAYRASHEAGSGRPGILRLRPWHKRLVYVALAALWLTGAAWLVFHYFIKVEGAFGPEPHWLEHWWLRAHGLFVFGGLLVLGPLFVLHAPRGWRTGRGRRFGVAIYAVLAWLAVSGYGLYYFSDLLPPDLLPKLHWITGLVAPLGLVAHILTARRRSES